MKAKAQDKNYGRMQNRPKKLILLKTSKPTYIFYITTELTKTQTKPVQIQIKFQECETIIIYILH